MSGQITKSRKIGKICSYYKNFDLLYILHKLNIVLAHLLLACILRGQSGWDLIPQNQFLRCAGRAHQIFIYS